MDVLDALVVAPGNIIVSCSHTNRLKDLEAEDILVVLSPLDLEKEVTTSVPDAQDATLN